MILIQTGRPARKPRTRKDMITYLEEHFRYSTMNSSNAGTSYAVNVKMHRIHFPDKATENAAYHWAWSSDDGYQAPYEAARAVLNDFARRHCYEWQIGFNGRSGGYLLLYQGGCKKLDYRSRCTRCGQLNFKLVPPEPLRFPEGTSEARLLELWRSRQKPSVELVKQLPEVRSLGFFPGEVEQKIAAIKSREVDTSPHGPYTPDAKCGRCGVMGRINLVEPLYETFITGGGTDQGEDFDQWTTDALRDRVELVWDFDRTVEKAVAAFVEEVQGLGPPVREDEEEGEESYGEVANG